jgi:hypothetical protein
MRVVCKSSRQGRRSPDPPLARAVARQGRRSPRRSQGVMLARTEVRLEILAVQQYCGFRPARVVRRVRFMAGHASTPDDRRTTATLRAPKLTWVRPLPCCRALGRCRLRLGRCRLRLGRCRETQGFLAGSLGGRRWNAVLEAVGSDASVEHGLGLLRCVTLRCVTQPGPTSYRLLQAPSLTSRVPR